MPRLIAACLLAAILLAGCATQQPAAPAQPPAATPPPAVTPPATTYTVPIPFRSLDQIALVELRADAPARRALLRPSTHRTQLQALLESLGSEIALVEGATPRFTLSLHPPEPEQPSTYLPVTADLLDRLPALAALEELMHPVEPGTRLWVIDPTGVEGEKLVFQHPEPLHLYATSPDGRWWLLVKSLAEYKGDYRAIPYLYDQSTGELREGSQRDIRGTVRWSGQGFFINRLVHMDLAFEEERYPEVREALALKPGERELIDFTTGADGNRFVALVGHPWDDRQPLDLVIGTLDGSSMAIVHQVMKGVATQSGVIAHASISPDGQWLTLAAGEESYLIPTADGADREAWIALQPGQAAEWSPHSRSFVLGGKVYDLTGRPVGSLPQGGIWHPDGERLIDPGRIYAPSLLVGLDGSSIELNLPDYAWPTGFLPDGRVLAIQVDYPAP